MPLCHTQLRGGGKVIHDNDDLYMTPLGRSNLQWRSAKQKFSKNNFVINLLRAHAREWQGFTEHYTSDMSSVSPSVLRPKKLYQRQFDANCPLFFCQSLERFCGGFPSDLTLNSRRAEQPDKNLRRLGYKPTNETTEQKDIEHRLTRSFTSIT